MFRITTRTRNWRTGGQRYSSAVGLAALLVEKEGDDASFALLPADHVIEDSVGFQATLATAFEAAEAEDQLVTVGIKPTFPSTGYGYLEQGKRWVNMQSRSVATVSRFVEKPNLAKAKEYLNAGNYFWNAGMFIWRPKVILAEIDRLVPKLSQGLQKLMDTWATSENLGKAMDEVYPGLEKISIDFAVMEKAERVAMVESSFDWDDVGEWPAIERHYPKDENGNVFKGDGVVDASDNLTFSEQGHCITLLGVKDLIVVQSGDATMVCHKDKAQEVKALAQKVGNLKPDLS